MTDPDPDGPNRLIVVADGVEPGASQQANSRRLARMVGTRLREERLKRGLTLETLARALRLTPGQLAAFEGGTERPSPGLLLQAAEFLGLTLGALFTAGSPLVHAAGSNGPAVLNDGRRALLRGDAASRRCGTRLDGWTFEPGPDSLGGLRVLVVEDDPHSAAFLNEALTWAGGRVIGPALNVQRALSLLAVEQPQVALLDVDMGARATSGAVATALADRGSPFLLVTGREDLVMADALLRAAPRLIKPVRPLDLIRAVAGLSR